MSSQKQWAEPPETTSEDGLRLYNSLLDEKTVFVPRGGPGSKDVYWYCCGPTVYDSAHIGHARNYVTFDIIRRVLEDHFGYNVTYVMNVTDVDDKIITRARRNHLVTECLQNGANLEKVINLCSDAIAEIVPRQVAKVEAAQQKLDEASSTNDSKAIKEYQERLDGDKLKLSKVQADAERVQKMKAGDAKDSTPQAIAREFQDIIGEYLDGLHGSTVTDIQIYRAHAAYFEKQFFDDLSALNCRMPHAIPRITDHIPEIVSFIEKIMANGFAYAAGEDGNKSVYFDTAAFRAAGHRYGKLEPWKVGSADLASEGESNFKTTEKRGLQASKTGEPSWESPWGPGRPGWHIECSAMVDSVLGTQIDIHSGGSDLRFPHHDNEIAQSEAYNCGCRVPTKFEEQWCNYWLHSGHLAIDGLKMSKSLKNFITIREALQEFSARQLRLLFCLSAWSQPITFNQQSRGEMVQKEATLKNFFLSVQVVLRTNALEKSSTRALPEHQAVAAAIAECQDAVNRAFMDNIDTVTAMDKILGLVNKVNTYIDRVCPAAGIQPDALRVRQAAEYITRVLRILGLSDAGPDDVGFSTRSSGGAAEQGAGASAVAGVFAAFASSLQALPHLSDVPADARARIDGALSGAPQQQKDGAGALEAFVQGKSADEVVDELVACRDVVRAAAREAGASKGDIMRICDEIRDISLVEIGIKLEDKPAGGVWMRVDAAELRKEMEEKRKAAAMAALDKAEKKLSMTKEELTKAEAVLKFATTQEALASKFRFNSENTVTHENKDGEWVEVDAKRLKAIGKIIEKEEKVRAPVTKKVAQNANYLADTQAKIAELEQQVQKLSTAGL